MTTAADIAYAHPQLAYLLRGLLRRMDRGRIPRQRLRDLPREIADALRPLSVSERSSQGFVRAFCARFEVNPAGGGYVDREGAEREARPAYALLPRRFLRPGTPEIEHARAAGDVACVRWDVLTTRIDFGALRIALHENPMFYATFATAPEADGEESMFETPEERATTSPWTATLPARLITPRAYRSVWTLVSNLAHGHDEKGGNVSLFRRERAVNPVTGEQYLRPMVSGNAVRGQWRDAIFYRLLRLVELRDTELPVARAHALFAGGTIEAGADTQVVDVGARRRARDVCPAWDLLAGCIDGQIMRGCLRVHDVTLVCRENAWVLYEQLRPTRDGVQLAYEEFERALPPADDLTQLRLGTRMAHRDLDGSDGSQMIYNTEVIVAGAQMVHGFQVVHDNGVSEIATSCLADLLEEFWNDAFVGAQNSKGLGRIAFDHYQTADGGTLPSPDIYRCWIGEHREEIRAWLLAWKGEADAPAPQGRGRRGSGKKHKAPPVEGPTDAAGGQQGALF